MKKLRHVKAAVSALLTLAILFAPTALAKGVSDRYADALSLLQQGDYTGAATAFSELGNYEDAARLAMYCRAIAAGEAGRYKDAVMNLSSLGDFRDAALWAKYYAALSYESVMDYETAAERLEGLEYFADVLERLAGYPAKVNARDYAAADAAERAGRLEEALEGFEALDSYSDSAVRAEAVREKISARDYAAADAAEAAGRLEEALEGFEALGEYSDSAVLAEAVREKINARDYAAADAAEAAGRLEEALEGFEGLGDYRDSAERAEAVRGKINARDYAAADAAEAADDYEKAYDGFMALGDYRDSAERVAAISDKGNYAKALRLAKSGDFKSAYHIFEALGDYEDSVEKAYVLSVTTFAERVEGRGEGIAAFRFHECWGIINLNENEITSPRWDSVGQYNALGLAEVEANDRHGYIDAMGNVVVPVKYAAVSAFSGNLCTVAVNRQDDYLFGLVDSEGNVVSEPQWRTMGDSQSGWSVKIAAPRFADGKMKVEDSRYKWGFIDEQGEVVGEVRWDEIDSFQGGVAVVREGKKYGLIDQRGAVLGEVRWDEIDSFHDDLAIVREGGHYGFIDHEGNVVIEPQYRYVRPFKEGMSAVHTESGWGYVNPANEMVIQPIYGTAEDFYKGFADVFLPGEGWQIIDKNGCLVYFVSAETRENYTKAIEAFEAGDYAEAQALFATLGDYRDSEAMYLESQYLNGKALLESGEYAAAAEAFDAIGDYKDAATQAQECRYYKAKALYDAGDYSAAYGTFNSIRGYRDVDALLEGDEALSGIVSLNERFSVGSTIRLGEYEQDDDSANGSEAIEWIVVERDDDRVILLSRYALDGKRYHDKKGNTPWKDCTLRAWLNGDFLNAAFSTELQAFLLPQETGEGTQDKVTLLSAEAFESWLNDEEMRACQPTDYAVAKGVKRGGSGACGWWLRSSGDSNGADGAYGHGKIKHYGKNKTTLLGVRPLIAVRTEDIVGLLDNGE